jgi:hypothetical protein
MTRSARAQPTPSVWARPPLPTRGGRTERTTWKAVGEALSVWCQYEEALGRLFGILITGDFPSPQCTRAFGAIRTFEARRDMLREAGRAYFAYFAQTAEAQHQTFRSIITEASAAVTIRNDLAHGAVMPYVPQGTSNTIGYCLLPSYYDSRKRDISNIPEFAYNVVTIKNYVASVRQIMPRPEELGNNIIHGIRERRDRVPPRWFL